MKLKSEFGVRVPAVHGPVLKRTQLERHASAGDNSGHTRRVVACDACRMHPSSPADAPKTLS